MENQIVVFEVGSEQFGVGIASVESIIKMQPITQLPHVSNFVEGVTNLRGKVLPVIDLRKRFGLTVSAPTKDSRIIVVEVQGATVGVVVDRVSEVLRVNTETIEPPSPLVTTLESAFITGIAKIGPQLVILLDLGRVLSTKEAESLPVL